MITATEKMSGKNEIEPSSTFKSHTYVYYCDVCKRKKINLPTTWGLGKQIFLNSCETKTIPNSGPSPSPWKTLKLVLNCHNHSCSRCNFHANNETLSRALPWFTLDTGNYSSLEQQFSIHFEHADLVCWHF